MKNTLKKIGFAAIIAVIGLTALLMTGCPPDDDDNGGGGGGGGSGVTVSIDMVSIPAGTFTMGSPTTEPNRYSDETQYSVTLSAFSMSKHLVTQAQYKAVMGEGEDRTTTSYGKGDNFPIYYVNWYDAIVFCNKLSIKEGLNPVYSIGGKTNPSEWGAIPTGSNTTWDAAVMDKSKNGYRLPTEAEWEYACRGDYANKATETNTKPFGIGDGTKMISGMANFDVKYPYDLNHSPAGNYNDTSATGYVGKTTAVGSYAANNYGLYDMHGNLYEWCWDWYGSYSSSPADDPTGAVTGSFRVVRGGYWSDYGRYVRSAYRSSGDPDIRYFIGFRLVRS
jgi:formylglycine-generating enzyme